MAIKKHPIKIIQAGSSYIPFQIQEMKTKSVRFRFNSKGGSINLPPYLSKSNKKAFIARGEDWVLKYVERNPHWMTIFRAEKYETGSKIQTSLKLYTIERIKGKDNKITAKLYDSKILLSAPETNKELFENLDSIRRALHRVISKDLKNEVDELIRTVNRETLQVNINKINIKYNHSNWGSCSSNGNINISSRLLFAPMWVIESVIKHELAHFKEMNHSSRFWNIIEAIDQKHKQANLWLKANSWHCDF